jgi:hypothetical protein
MSVHSAALLALALSMATPLPSLAGPCSSQIDDIQARIDAKIAAEAAAGKEGAESVSAMKHRQPTPKTMAEAEVKIGDVSEKYAAEVGHAMAQARSADLAGDGAECEKALGLVRRSLGD